MDRDLEVVVSISEDEEVLEFFLIKQQTERSTHYPETTHLRSVKDPEAEDCTLAEDHLARDPDLEVVDFILEDDEVLPLAPVHHVLAYAKEESTVDLVVEVMVQATDVRTYAEVHVSIYADLEVV